MPYRVLVLHSRYSSGSVSGENRVVDDEVQLLRQHGHDVLTLQPSAPTGGLNAIGAASSALYPPGLLRRIRKMVKAEKIQVVHVHNVFPKVSPAAFRTAAAVGARVVLTLHNYRYFCLPATFVRDGEHCDLCFARYPGPGVRYRCYRGSLPASAALAGALTTHRVIGSFDRVSAFVAISDFVRDKYIRGGFPPRQLHLKRHFTFPTARRSGPGDYFLFVGRLTPEKGLEWLISNWRAEYGKLVIAGDGPQLVAVRNRAIPNVDAVGSLAPHDLAEMIRGARAVLVPSEWEEPAGRVAIEAYAAGVPVITSDAGALPEVVSTGETGLVVPKEWSAWEWALHQLLDDATSERMGRRAYEMWTKEFSPACGIRGLERLYQKVLDGAA